MNVMELFRQMRKTFEENHFESADVEAAYTVEYATGIRHNLLMMQGNRVISDPEYSRAAEYLKRRMANEPFQYIFGWTEFRELTLKVGPGCLIPRPETEQLVEHAIHHLPHGGTVLELGTGSGAIALSIGFERRDARVLASEISPEALKYAEWNACQSGVTNVSFYPGDLLSPFPADIRADVLTANLPYIPESARNSLPPNVRDYEPELALFAENDGRELMERALKDAPVHLKTGAWLIFEIGEEQGAALSFFAGQLGCYTEIEILRDWNRAERFFTCRYNGQ